MDIVARLRSVSGEQAPYANDLVHKWCLEAADEIERLRVAVAAERERWFRVTEVATTAAIVETREACAKIVEKMSGADAVYPEGIRMIADAIRARSD